MFTLSGRYGHQVTGIGDVDGDGKIDLVYAANGDAFVWRGCGDGTFETTPVASAGVLSFQQPQGLPTVVLTGVAVADFTGDGRADLLGLGPPNGTYQNLVIEPGRSDATFAAPLGPSSIGLPPHPNPTSTLAFIGDLNGDGVPDLLFQNGWYDPMVNRCISLVSLVAPGGQDIDCQGRQGVAGLASVGKILGNGHVNASFGSVYQPLSGTPTPHFYIFDGSGNGAFVGPAVNTAPMEIAVLAGYLSVSWRDLDRDGKDDAIAEDDGTHPAQIFWNDGGLSFTPGPMEMGLHPGDFDHDGKLDIVTGSSSPMILFGDGARGFGNAIPAPVRIARSGYEVVDVNGDGVDDIIDGVRSNSVVSIYLSTGKRP